MSRTFSIFCMDCKRHLWIAQTHGDQEAHLYRGARTMADFQRFLNEHIGHTLKFEDDERYTEPYRLHDGPHERAD